MPAVAEAVEQQVGVGGPEAPADDELVEVTPKNIRMRKRILVKELRMKKAAREAL